MTLFDVQHLPRATSRGVTQRLLWTSVALLVVINLGVMAVGFALTPAGHTFTGLHAGAPVDELVYESYLEQTRQGSTLIFRDLYTSEPQVPTFVSPFWYGIGLLGRLLGTTPPVTFHLARLLSIPLLLFAVAAAVRRFLREPREQRYAFLTVVFGAGVGWVLSPLIGATIGGALPIERWPLDLWVAEAFPLLAVFQSPHFAIGTALLIAVVLGLLDVVERGIGARTFFTGAAALLLTFTTPFLLPLLAALTLAITWFGRHAAGGVWRAFGRVCAVWAIALPAVIWTWLYQSYDALARGRAAQNVLLLPLWWAVLAGYGLLLPLAVSGVRILWSNRSQWTTRVLLAWLLCQPIVFALPLFFQRRLTQGWMVPLGIASGVGVAALLASLRRRLLARQLALASIVALIFIGPGASIAIRDVRTFATARGATLSGSYLPSDFDAAYAWLIANTTTRDTIVADPSYAGFIPARTGRRIAAGHSVETLDFDAKFTLARALFSNALSRDDFNHAAVRDGWTYVWVTAAERRFGFDVGAYPLRVVYENPSVTIAAVDLAQ